MDFAVGDSYFVVAHFHYVLAGTVLFEMFAGFYFWWPKMTGKMLNSRIGKAQFWVMFIGFNMTFLVQHWMGVEGMPRRVANYPDLPGNVTSQHHLLRRIVAAGPVDPHVLLEYVRDLEARGAGHRRGPVGLLQLAGMGHVLSAAPAQLLPDPADQVRAARVRGALPRHQVGPCLARDRAGDTDSRKRGRKQGVGGVKVEGWLFLGSGIFFAGADIVYWYTSKDPTGTTALALAVGLALLIGFYVLFTGRRLPMRPEDDNEGEIAQGTGEIGFFSPHSWWPLFLGLSAATMGLGLAIGWWLFLIGLLFVVFSTVGFVFEYYRGHFSH